VTKETADLVLRDDNFATIVAAVEEGRMIFDNIRKFAKYLLSANCGELWVMFLAPLVGMPLPLMPLQILWINLVTDGPPALALGIEPPEPGIMQRPPFPAGETIFGRGLGWDILWIGLLMGTVSLGVGYWYWRDGADYWQTMVFATLTFSQFTLALAVRSESESFFMHPLAHRYLIAAIALTLGLQFAVMYIPALRRMFELEPLSLANLGICMAMSLIVFIAVEIKKAIF
jgi:Ca2+-transporting ATPase